MQKLYHNAVHLFYHKGQSVAGQFQSVFHPLIHRHQVERQTFTNRYGRMGFDVYHFAVLSSCRKLR
jgi:hypothetical protein